MYLNGIVMVSTVLDLGTISFYPGQDLAYILYLPSYAATAWFHKTLKDRPEHLNAFLDEARKFARGEYADALMKGDALGKDEKAEIVKKVARFTGLGEDYLNKANLRVRLFQFMQELQRNRGLTTGRLDARFAGPTYKIGRASCRERENVSERAASVNTKSFTYPWSWIWAAAVIYVSLAQ